MSLNKSWALTRYWKSGSGVITTAQVRLTFTSDEFPGATSVHEGTVDISGANLTDETNSEAIIAAAQGAMGLPPVEFENFHYEQLRFNYNMAQGTQYETTPSGSLLVYPTLSPRQLRLALAETGTTEADVDAMIEEIPAGADGNTRDRDASRIEWKYATSFKRDHPLVLSLGVGLGYSEEQINSLWLWASRL